MNIEGGSLRIRSTRVALGYLDGGLRPVADADGFVDTGDIVEVRNHRCYFLGRSSGVINVGGLKVYPEEVEATINRHPAVRMSLVRSRRNAITGAIVSADVLLNQPLADGSVDRAAAVRREILQLCRDALAPHKVPAMVNFVTTLDAAGAGKLARS
jgi:acyl-CoA synthetase (AMP-forming)/AMP-acid ligase II